jgi:hypothetical protein
LDRFVNLETIEIKTAIIKMLEVEGRAIQNEAGPIYKDVSS